MSPRRVLLIVLAASFVVAGMWISGGDAWASRRELRCERDWAATFGSFDDLKKKYPKRERNDTAEKLEELTRGSVFALAPVVREPGSLRPTLSPAESSNADATLDYVAAETTTEEAQLHAPPESLALYLEETRILLDSVESTLTTSPAPAWPLDISATGRDTGPSNVLTQIRLQRVLMARALSETQSGRDDLAARSLEASWNLNESIRSRPDTTSILIAIAVSRLQAGVLRKVRVDENLWKPRVAGMDLRPAFFDALVVESRPNSSNMGWRAAWAVERDAPWYQRVVHVLSGPMGRVAMVGYYDLMREELVQLKSTPLVDQFPPASAPNIRDTAHIITSISMPSLQNSFLRAGRLVVDAELTGKILEAKRLRRENGNLWPASIPGIEASRFPGASWRYEAASDGGRMSLAFSRELTSPSAGNGAKPLPLRFSSN